MTKHATKVYLAGEEDAHRIGQVVMTIVPPDGVSQIVCPVCQSDEVEFIAGVEASSSQSVEAYQCQGAHLFGVDVFTSEYGSLVALFEILS